jgi:hypothetical protein
MFFLDRLAREFRVLARVAQEGGAIIDKINSVNKMVTKEGVNGVCGDVAEWSVEHG